jgi:hypothetical protein
VRSVVNMSFKVVDWYVLQVNFEDGELCKVTKNYCAKYLYYIGILLLPL